MVQYVVSLQITSIISILCSTSVLLTCLIFDEMRRKLFMQIIAFISLGDLIANSPYLSTARPPNGNWQCSLDGFINLYFYPVSWVWTTTLMFFLYSLATKGKLPLSALRIHSICWGFPLVLTLLNLTTNTFGMGASHPYEVCILSANKNQVSAEIWHITTYYGLWLICITLMLYMYLRLIFMNQKDLSAKFPMWQASIAPLQLYPLAMFVCWIPHIIAVFCEYFDWFNGLNVFYFVSDIIKITHGAVTAFIFFANSREARARWKKVFRRRLADCKSLKMKLLRQNEVKDVDNSIVVQDFSAEFEEENFSISRTIHHSPSPSLPEGYDSSILLTDNIPASSSITGKSWLGGSTVSHNINIPTTSSNSMHNSSHVTNAIHFQPHEIDSRNASVDIC